jgi:hypothetical protein
VSLIVAVALTPAEQEFVIRAVRELVGREDAPQAADVLAMLENAIHPGVVGGLDPNRTHDETWWR